ncbi:hypothetical protein AgCh_010305 [Apium graveolens]
MSQERYSDEYVIVYTNGRTVQGHRVILSTSKVDILIRAKVQGAFSTYRMLYLTAGTITMSSSASVCLCGVYVAGVSSLLQDQFEELARHKQDDTKNSGDGKRSKLVVIGQNRVEPLQALKSSGHEVHMDFKGAAENRKRLENQRKKRREEKKCLHDQKRKQKKRLKGKE